MKNTTSPWIENMNRMEQERQRTELIHLWAVIATVVAFCGWATAIAIILMP